MKCPNCDFEIQDGHLMCENCGNEIQIVPDFEPEVENALPDPMTDISGSAVPKGKTVVDKMHQDLSDEDFLDDNNPFGDESKEELIGRRISRIIMIAAIVVVFVLAGISKTVIQNSNAFMTSRAKSMMNSGKYGEALVILEDAISRYPDDVSLRFKEIECYKKLGDTQNALLLLQGIIDSSELFDIPDIEKAYDQTISILDEQKAYQTINELLAKCEDETIVSSYQNYLAMAPTFSVPGGSYEETTVLKIGSNTSGKIFYTMDGSNPTQNSMLYSSPIMLDGGNYTIKAMFMNNYGIISEISSQEYVISVDVPEGPVVLPAEGFYHVPTMVTAEAEVGCQIYYTVDDTEPTLYSVPYTGPIPMPLGTTTFQFVSYGPSGVPSEITAVTYELSLPGGITTNEAVSKLVNRLVENGYLTDNQGHKTGVSGVYKYVFSSVLRIGRVDDYYTINEYYDEGNGISTRTDKVYLVQVYTGAVARLGYAADGSFAANSF